MFYKIILHALSITTGEGKGLEKRKREDLTEYQISVFPRKLQSSDDSRTHLQCLISDGKDHTPLSQAGLCSSELKIQVLKLLSSLKILSAIQGKSLQDVPA